MEKDRACTNCGSVLMNVRRVGNIEFFRCPNYVRKLKHHEFDRCVMYSRLRRDSRTTNDTTEEM